MLDRAAEIVFLVESDDERRRALSSQLTSLGFTSRDFKTAEQFLVEAGSRKRGCVLSGLRLQGISGLELQDRLVEQRSPLPILFVAERSSTKIIVSAMRRGALSFLDMPTNEDDVWMAIREAMVENARRYAEEQHRSDLLSRFTALSDGENAVLFKLCEGHTNKEIAAGLDVSVRTVEARRRRILEKTACRSLPELMLSYQDFKQSCDRAEIKPLIASLTA